MSRAKKGKSPSAKNRREAARLHRVAQRAVWRLNFLEWFILLGAMTLAMGGGAAVAWLIAPTLDAGFRPTWVVTSLLLFVVPGVIALIRDRMAEKQ